MGLNYAKKVNKLCEIFSLKFEKTSFEKLLKKFFDFSVSLTCKSAKLKLYAKTSMKKGPGWVRIMRKKNSQTEKKIS